MKPIPAPSSQEARKPDEAASMASGLITPSPGTYSASNRRSQTSDIQKAYPWLLVASTAVAVVFGMMYITKPVVVASGNESKNEAPTQLQGGKKVLKSSLLPNRNALPGEKAGKTAPGDPKDLVASSSIHSEFEETNMRVQHILTAKSPDGHLSRIDLEVPVLYQSRELRWTEDEVAHARELLARLMDYQDKTNQLKSEGRDLLVAWNKLVGASIPATHLRADSPSLPENQHDAIAASTPIDTTTRDAIEILTEEDKP